MEYVLRNVKPVFEFLLWDNCKNNCKFCYQKLHYNKFDFIHRQESIQLVKSFIESNSFISNSHILLVGGELFDNINNLNIISDLIIFIANKMKNNIIDLLYVNTNLLYDNLSILNKFLTVLDSYALLPRVKFTTSYDVYGRYETVESEKLFFKNLKYIKNKFNNLNIVVNSILTKQFCESILTNKFSIKTFCTNFSVKVNTIPYINFNDELLADRLLIFKTLSYINNENPGFLESYIYDMDIKQEKRLYVYKNNSLNYESSILNTCGHSINFKKYSLNDTCFVCDLKKMFL